MAPLCKGSWIGRRPRLRGCYREKVREKPVVSADNPSVSLSFDSLLRRRVPFYPLRGHFPYRGNPPSRRGGGFRRFLFPFAVLFLLVPVIIHKEREDNKDNQDCHQGDGNVHARRVLYIVGDIP